MSGKTVLKIKGVSLRFGGISALSNVSFSVEEGEIFSIIGPNGAGKTSLLNCFNGFYKPFEGSIKFKDHELTKLSPRIQAKKGFQLSRRTFKGIFPV